MSPSNIPKSSSASRGDASKITPDPAAIRAGTVAESPNEGVVSNSSSTYISSMSDYDRFEMIRRDMWEKHRWTISTFLRQMVTAEPGKPYDWSTKTRVKKLSEAIAQKEVAEPLVRSSDKLREIGVSGLVDRLRIEIKRLGSSDIGLGNFDPEASVHGLDISGLYGRIQETAPELCGLLLALMEPKYAGQRDRVKACEGSITMICSSIAYAHAPRTYDNFAVLLGVHLHAMGTKRRTLNVLAGLGLIPSYQTVMRKRAELAKIGKVLPLSCMDMIRYILSVIYDRLTSSQQRIKEIAQTARQQMIISWDNFDYGETVRHQSLRDPSRHICATTEKLCISQNMPVGGLRKSMFHPHLSLDVNDVFLSPGNLDDEILHQTQRYWIAEAIRYTHRAAIHDVFTDELDGWPHSARRTPVAPEDDTLQSRTDS